MSEVVFRAEELTKLFTMFDTHNFCLRPVKSLYKFNMEIHQGEIYGFVGKNGSGKTTLLRILTGILLPDDGTIELFGETDPKQLFQQRAYINGIAGSPALYPHLTARQHLKMCCMQRGITDQDCIEAALKTTGLNQRNVIAKRAKDFSLGMKQRLAIAMALIGNPRFLFFDEPLNGLDPEGIIGFRELIKELNKGHGITILISSHMLEELGKLATCYGFIYKGEMLEQISAADLKKKLDRYINIRTDDIMGVEKILRTEFQINDFEIIDDDIIQLREKVDQSSIIMRTLFNREIDIKEITESSENLESHYTALIEENKNKFIMKSHYLKGY